jgi:AbrB family looped-hinge helix DNA binding protein
LIKNDSYLDDLYNFMKWSAFKGGIVMYSLGSFDKNGAIKISKQLRELLGIYEGDQFVVMEDEGEIRLIRYTATCLACGDDTDVRSYNRTFLCGECRESINRAVVESEEKKEQESKENKGVDYIAPRRSFRVIK